MPVSYTNRKGEVRWRARWRTGKGERHSRSGFLSVGDARALEEAMRTARREGKPVRLPKTQLTIDQYWELWWEQEVTVGKTRATQHSYRGAYACYIRPRIGRVSLRELIDDPQLLVNWRSRLARDKSEMVLDHAHRVLSSMLSAAVEEGVIPHNPLSLLTLKGRRGRKRTVTRSKPRRKPVAIDPAGWFLVMEYLRRPTRPPVNGDKPRTRANPLDLERDALMVPLGFMAGFRLPSEALGLTHSDVRDGRLYMEGRSSEGEYTPGSKTGPGRDLPIQTQLAAEFNRVERAYADAGQPLGREDFWLSVHRLDVVRTEHQARNWREREFRPVARQIALDFPQFAELRNATPYTARHTFMSCCLQAGISPATIAGWCGTSIQMISQTYGRVIPRYEGASPVPLDEQLRTGRAEAMSLLSATSTTPPAQPKRPTGPPPTRDPKTPKKWPMPAMPPPKRRRVADKRRRVPD
jgi:integrase